VDINISKPKYRWIDFNQLNNSNENKEKIKPAKCALQILVNNERIQIDLREKISAIKKKIIHEMNFTDIK